MTEPAPQLSIVALGGLGQVGMNALVLEESGGLVLVDCGVTFGGGELGVELYEPRFDYVLERAERLRAILLTHGHEDHIGAVPSLLRALVAAREPVAHGVPRGPHDPAPRPRPVSGPLPPVWGPPYALELCLRRLGEDAPELVSAVELRPIVPGERFTAGPFTVEPLRVTHSIVDAAALAIETVAGLVVHTGDFKLDQEPIDGQPTDEERLLALGARGVRLLLSDSTNVLAPGWSGSERSAAAALEVEVAAAEGRVVVGLFASNVHRLCALGELARRQGRRVCLLGRSARTHFEAASKLGLLAWPSELVVSPQMAASLAHRSVLYVVTGTQAEPRSALRRLASGLHPELRIGPGDTVLLSSRAIPGNERIVFAMVDDLLRLGARVVTRQHAPGIHVSGHAHKDELARILELVRPRAFLPVHGALHHLVAHGALARELGIAEVVVAENGVRLALGAVEPLRRVGEVPAGRVARTLGRVVPQEVLRQRLELSRSGAVVCHVVVADDGRLCAVRVAAPGSGLGAAACAALEAAVVRDFVWPGRDATETELGELVRRELRRALKADFERPPHIEVLVARLPRPSVVRSRAHAVIRQSVQAHLAVARSGAERLAAVAPSAAEAAAGTAGAEAKTPGEPPDDPRPAELPGDAAGSTAAAVPDPEAVHDLRVGLRRLRTVLRVARPLYGEVELAELGRGLRGYARATGELRDAEVLLETLLKVARRGRAAGGPSAAAAAEGVSATRSAVGIELLGAATAEPRGRDPAPPVDLAAALEPWLERIRRQERRLRSRMVRRTARPDFERLLREVERAIERGPLDRAASHGFQKRALDTALADVRELIAVDGDDVAGLHELRIRFKRLRYTAEMLAGGADAAHRPAGQRLARIAELAARMQKLLGDLHDVDVAADCAGATRRIDEATRALLQAALRARRLELVADALGERVRIARALRL